ncbi:hypothetical protein H2200_009880 [Cladophialophora chaetospira]|uniref:Peptidase S28 n=1 Tax=Cladophialophora chaetospira TaxID=386627 RepID=A0AA38X394_9EURO|nr:hypothetical protein H2200_009880 [Cladophialophora chaetospira]
MRLFQALCLLTGDTTAVLAQGLPPGAYTPPAANFTQKLNHGSNDGITFQQLYQLDTSNFKPGGPILFHQGEEGPMKPIASKVFSDYAPKLGGIVATLEHRFFGTSYPHGTSWDNTTTAQYSPLTLDNVLQDSVAFVKWLKKTIPGAGSSKVIISGGSYGGFLATQARIRHPDKFYGALALSPPLTSFGASATIEDNPYKFAVQDWMANVFWDANAEAALKIKNALSGLWDCIQASTCPTAMSEFDLCTPPTSSIDWLMLLQSVIMNQYRLMTQYNFGSDDTYPANPLALVVNATLKARTTGQVLRIKNDRTGTSWGYISCAWFVQSAVATSPDNSLFPPFSINSSVTGCGQITEWAGYSYNQTNAEWVDNFNLTDKALDRVSRLLITHGSYDSTAAIGMPHLTSSSNRNHSCAILVTGMAHRENQSPEAVLPRGVRPQVD